MGKLKFVYLNCLERQVREKYSPKFRCNGYVIVGANLPSTVTKPTFQVDEERSSSLFLK